MRAAPFSDLEPTELQLIAEIQARISARQATLLSPTVTIAAMSFSAENTPMLDGQELLHLAIIDSGAGRKDAALLKLKRAVELLPDNAVVHHLLGAEYAEIGMIDRAVESMQRAVDLAPALHTAHFQLGLLHFTQMRIAEAEAAWAGLDDSDAARPLRLFKDALLYREAGRLAESIEFLEAAIGLPTASEALVKDMQRVLQGIRERLEASAADAADATEESAAHALAARYKDTSTH